MRTPGSKEGLAGKDVATWCLLVAFQYALDCLPWLLPGA